MTQYNANPQHPMSQMHGLIDNLLGRHGDDMTPEQRQELNGYKQHLTQNQSSYAQNPQGMQNVFNGVLRVAAPFIIGYGVNALLGGGQQGGSYGGGSYAPNYGGASGGLGGGLGGLITGALPGIIGGLGGGGGLPSSGGQSGGFGAQPPSFGNQGGAQSV